MQDKVNRASSLLGDDALFSLYFIKYLVNCGCFLPPNCCLQLSAYTGTAS